MVKIKLIQLKEKCKMSQLIKKQLKSNFLRFTKDDYSYKNVFIESFKEKLPLFISIFFMNIILFALSIATDCVVWLLNVPYWYSLLMRIPVILYALVSFQVWKSKIGCFIETFFIVCSVFVPIWSIFIVVYLVFRTFVQMTLYDL